MFNKLNKLANKLNITCVENTAKNRLNSRTKRLMTAKSGRAIIKNNSRYERILATMAGGGRAKNRSEKAWNLFVLYNQRITTHPCTIKAHNHSTNDL